MNVKTCFDYDKTKSVIEKYPKFSYLLNQLVIHTQYYTTIEVIEGIKSMILQWSQNRKSIPLFINAGRKKKSSSYWLYSTIKDLLPEHDLFLYGKTFDPDTEIEILFIDDWMLSGVNAASNFEDVLHRVLSLGDVKEKDDMSQEIYHYKRNKITYTIISFISTNDSNEIINELFLDYRINGKIISLHNIPSFHSILVKLEQEMTDDRQKITKELCQELTQEFAPDSMLLGYPVLLEYKIANQFGCLELFYEQCYNPITPPYF